MSATNPVTSLEVLKNYVESFLIKEGYLKKIDPNWVNDLIENNSEIQNDSDQIVNQIIHLLKNKKNKMGGFHKQLLLNQLQNYVNGKIVWSISVIKYCLLLKTISSRKIYDSIRGISNDNNEYNILLPCWRTLQKYVPQISFSNGLKIIIFFLLLISF